MDWDQIDKRNYESTVFWDLHWITKADDLLASAALLEPEVRKVWKNLREYHAQKVHKTSDKVSLIPDRHIAIYLMLVAFAVENLLKASVVRDKKLEYEREFERSGSLPKELKSHDLTDLARRAGLRFDIAEEDLLRRLSRSAMWFGRYPVPLHYKQTALAEMFSDGKHHSVSYLGGSDIDRLNVFIDRIRVELDLPTRYVC